MPSFTMRLAAYSATATMIEFGFPETGAGKMLASTTLNPSTPITLK